MGNSVKYSTGSETKSLKMDNMYLGTGGEDRGPTSTTGFYKATAPPSGGYRVYSYNANTSGNLAYHTAANDSELIAYTNQIAGQSYTTINQCFNYYIGQSDKFCMDAEYPATITDGLVFFNDYGFIPSYPRNGTSGYDLSSGQVTGTIKNSPTYTTTDEGEFNFNGNGATLGTASNIPHIDFGSGTDLNTLNDTDITVEVWVKEINTTSTYNLGLAFNHGFSTSTQQNNDPYITLGRVDANNLLFEVANGNSTGGVYTNIPLSNSAMISRGWTLLTGVLKKENGYYNPYLYADGSLVSNSIYAYYDNQGNSVTFTPPATAGYTTYNFVGTSKVTIVGTFLNTFNNALAWLGKISTVKVYNRALSVDEITHNYNSEKSRYGIT